MGASEVNITDRFNYGYRIYHLIKGGPLEKNNIKEISDFIIPSEEVINRKLSFDEWIKSFAGHKAKIKIYSLLERNFKEIEIIANEIGSKDGILGAAVKNENFVTANKNLLHIIKVNKNSFSENKLGLIAEEDYIIAVKPKNYPIITLNKEDFNPLEILSAIISQNKGNFVTFYIFNIKNGARKIDITLDKDRNFSLGCECAYGALHEFPKEIKKSENTEKYKDILFKNDSNFSEDIII